VIPNNAPNGDTVIGIGDDAFKNTNILTVVIPDSVTSINVRAFQNCGYLTEITIPNSVNNIGKNAFQNCSRLKTVVLPDGLECIEESTFENCESLSAIVIPDSVTSIGNSAFQNCSSLSSITIPDSVTVIGDYAFFDCTVATEATLGDGLEKIGHHSFSGCDSLTSISVPYLGASPDQTENAYFDENDRIVICYSQSLTKTMLSLPDKFRAFCQAASVALDRPIDEKSIIFELVKKGEAPTDAKILMDELNELAGENS
jgi:hypothetical protein